MYFCNTVRILFYGQSITEQDRWQDVRKYIRFTYTNAVTTVGASLGRPSSIVMGRLVRVGGRIAF